MFRPDVIIAVVLALVLREYARAWVAVREGDMTPIIAGRLTLNPMAHLDVLGLVFLLVAGFGWGKPGAVNYDGLRRGNFSMFLVAGAALATNAVLALGALGLLALVGGLLPGFVVQLLMMTAMMNTGFFLFQLLPIYPLDGERLLLAVVPELEPVLATVRPVAPLVLLLALVVPALLGSSLITPLVRAVFGTLLTLFGLQ